MKWMAWIFTYVFLVNNLWAVDFHTEIIPLLTKAGCNAGACHGAAAGRGGFHLSLLGGDPTADYESIARAFEGRRINLAKPDASLLLLKPTSRIEHGGDVAIEEGSVGERLLVEWIRSGAIEGRSDRLVSFEVTPRRYVGRQTMDKVALRAMAVFEKSPSRDVTEWTVFSTTDPAAIEINAENVATIKRRGQHVIIARFLDRVVPLQVVVPISDHEVDFKSELRTNFIDDEVFQTLTEMRIAVSPPATDAAWLRRVTLDLTGRLPALNELDSFLNERSIKKREQAVDRLLASEAFVDFWTLRFSKWLRMHSLPNDKEGVQVYAEWVRQELRDDTGLDQMARHLLTSVGDSHRIGPANFARMVSDARDHAELVGKFFLGVRLGCANCHNHPLDRWTQDDFHGLAAVFAALDRNREVRVLTRGAVTNLRTNEPAIPRIPGEKYLEGVADHRDELAGWITDPANRYFARAMVNRLWQTMMGRGLIEPTDDLRETNPATHPDLLEKLANDFIGHGYRIRHTLRLIALSQSYARSDTTNLDNDRDDRFYSHAMRRPLLPEVLADAIADVTGVANQYEGLDLGARAVTIVDPLIPAPSLDLLGRCSRLDQCEEGDTTSGGLPSQLHRMNGGLVNEKLADDRGRLRQLIAQGKPDSMIIREFFSRALSRSIDDDELQQWEASLVSKSSDERRSMLEDFVWSLLNHRDFINNH